MSKARKLLLGSILFLTLHSTAYAQITPDTTLGKESSVVAPNSTINGASADLINGGQVRGNNLFHSFTQFNISDGQRVYFANPVGVQNILTRVTGGQASNILGTLGVNGGANLFFINPSGILFGTNARLDISGSFAVTTASSIKFANGTEFSATAPQNNELLSISVPTGLQFNGNEGNIINQSLAINSEGKTVGLEVKPNKTLAIVGGNVYLNGSYLTGSGGRIELASVNTGIVNLIAIDKGWLLTYNEVQNFKQISLEKAIFDIRGTNGMENGSIRVNGNYISTSGYMKPGNLLEFRDFPQQITDATKLFVQICPRNSSDKPLAKLIVTGRGNFPPSPLDMMPGTTPVRALAKIEGETSLKRANVSLPKINPPIIEAQGFVKTSDGNIELVAAAPNITPSQINAHAVCPQLNNTGADINIYKHLST